MQRLNRREFLAYAAALGVSAAWGSAHARNSRVAWSERRELYPEGVASGDPQSDSVILWTRRPFTDGRDSAPLTVEVAEDAAFHRVIATTSTPVSAASDWTCRVLVGGLKPAHEYWYRFTDATGAGSRVGRTLTAPADNDARTVRFTFVSCQNVCQGAQNAYRRMIFEDERAPAAERLNFVLHLGDFVYEIVWYPEERPQGMYDRRLRDLVRYATGEKHADFHIPTTVDDYRTLYRAYLHDPDLQDARARWPFVAMWDNHEFSWLGWQGFQKFGDTTVPAQTRKVAANQAWFEYQPARVRQATTSLERFAAPQVSDAPVTRFDANGLGDEPNNLTAIGSLTAYRALRFGRNVDLLITDQHSYRSEEPTTRPEAAALNSEDFPEMIPQEAMEILDAGRAYAGGHPPASIRFGDTEVPNFCKDQPPQTILGVTQKAWFLDRLKSSAATWKIWGNSLGTLDFRADPQNLPPNLTKPWPGAGYAGFGGGDHSAAYVERAEIYDLVRNAGITGFATVAGDRHSFWARLAARSLPPEKFEPVGIAFITGSISAPGLPEAYEHRFPRDHPLRALYLAQKPGQSTWESSVNLLLHHGVRTCLEYQASGDIERARKLSNPDLAPHLSFIDMGGHGYATVRASSDAMECEFVCIPRPLERSDHPDGGPLRYRVVHRAALWKKGEAPRLEQRVLDGSPTLSI
ncbi:MAG TPA: alkaline phosphatase D family protein [Povalibacter sp.]|nr:alkaline phosphatase D family protein [Povalibacter sp.]